MTIIRSGGQERELPCDGGRAISSLRFPVADLFTDHQAQCTFCKEEIQGGAHNGLCRQCSKKHYE